MKYLKPFQKSLVVLAVALLGASAAHAVTYELHIRKEGMPSGVKLQQYSGYRAWSDGVLATSCLEYRTGKTDHGYSGATGDGVYRISVGGGTADVYCDMTADGGGWTLLMKQAMNDGTTLQGDTAYWTAGTQLNDTAASLNLTDGNFVSKAFSALTITQLRLNASNEATAQYQNVVAGTPLAAFSNAKTAFYTDDVGDPGTVAYPNWFIRATTYPDGELITTSRFGLNFAELRMGNQVLYCGVRWGWAANENPKADPIYVGSHDSCGGLGAYGKNYGSSYMAGNKNAWQPGTLYLWGR